MFIWSSHVIKTRGLEESSFSDIRYPGFPGRVGGEERKTMSYNVSDYAGQQAGIATAREELRDRVADFVQGGLELNEGEGVKEKGVGLRLKMQR